MKAKFFEGAEGHFQDAEELAIKCGNNGNVTLLREAQHCIEVYMDKLAQEELQALQALEHDEPPPQE